MQLPDDAQASAVRLSLARQWISKAEIDLRTAERLSNDTDPIRESIAFHCQQAAEKYLKAYLVSRSIAFPKTHSIGRLLDLVAVVAPQMATALEETEFLSPFGIELRYPGDYPEILPGQEQTALDLARLTSQTIMAQIDGDARAT